MGGFIHGMNKQIRSTIISLCIIVVLIVAVLIGAKKGVFKKLANEMPTLEAKETKNADSDKNTTAETKDHSSMTPEEIEMESLVNYYMKPGEIKKLDPNKPFGGYDVVKLGEQFELHKIPISSSKGGNKEDYYYNATVKSCKISRECDFDFNAINFGIENKKQYMDSNHNFISDFYYMTIEIEFTNVNDVLDGLLMGQWSTFCLNDNGTYYILKPSIGEPIGGTNDNGNTHGNYTFAVGETKTMTRYYVLTDKAATQTRLAIAFGKPVQTAYTGPWVIVHEPENN